MKDTQEAQSLPRNGLNYSINSSYFDKNLLNSQEILQKKARNFNFKVIDLDILKLDSLDLKQLNDNEISKLSTHLERKINADKTRAIKENKFIKFKEFVAMEQSIRTGNKDIHLKYYRAKDTDLNQEIEFISPFNGKNLFVKGAVHMIAANPGGYKTTFVSDICAELLRQDKFKTCYHIDPENTLKFYRLRNQEVIINFHFKNQWHLINPMDFNENRAFTNIFDFIEYFKNFDNSDTILFFDSYGIMIDRNNNAEVSKFLTQCQDLSNKTGATIIITTHNNKNGLVYTGGASNFQYVSLFYQLHTIKRENGSKALLLECTKSRYGTQEQFTQGYEINFNAQTCTPERYTIIDEYEVSELIEQVYNKANGTARQIKESKKAELSRPETIEKIADILKASGRKTAHEIATDLKISAKYEQNFLKPILQDNLGAKWLITKDKDKRGNTREFYTITPDCQTPD